MSDYPYEAELDEDYEDICGDCGCIMPDDGSPCDCECGEDVSERTNDEITKAY